MKKIISLLLGILGFTVTSCYHTKYGVPEASFHLQGKITDENANPIGNIRIRIDNNTGSSDTVYSSQTGYFENQYTVFEPDNTFTIHAEDTDGENNKGNFKSQSKTITLSQNDFNQGKGEWYDAIASKEVIFNLKKQ